MPAECRSCRAPIVWATLLSRAGKASPHPIDALPSDEPTNLAARRATEGKPEFFARYLTEGETPEAGERYAVSHFATCPNAAAHRKPAGVPSGDR